ncbi:uncharacterized protein MELLADRAFT_70303 [Melampsora larici-populina 98AG31]|uniref:Uncharacterized protein n=1 Tax=Melampsora larici-populina (strain 98AG31 / pathotype 3-4-7) TaxID=747676 RepID=F4SEE8_MELLP|nr:uncharacterized protein MELLADRAFT_70303 [Melampsora larici-populina 98AG31]EGF96977.1 hypothetical protein MELLADRAFT_70303 [Melampsora larici-populina 98AG31]
MEIDINLTRVHGRNCHRSEPNHAKGNSGWVHQTANMERGRPIPNRQNTNVFSEPRMANARPPSTPNNRSTPIDVACTPTQQRRQVNPTAKPKLWLRPSKTSQNDPTTSLRKQRDTMTPENKDDDQNTSRAIQQHFRYLAGVGRLKHSFPRSPTFEDLEALPDLPDGTAPLGLSAAFLLRADQLSQEWVEDDTMGEGFRNRCEQRLRQYGIPYVGLSSARHNPKADEWNRRTLEFCLDTFNCAVDGLEYDDLYRVDREELDVDRIRELVATHLKYCINNKRIFLKDNTNLQKHMKEDRRAKRAMNLADRRHEACLNYEDLNVYQDLFLDRRYCSSDESDDEVMEQDRVRDIPLWRSRLGTALVEYIDGTYLQLRQEEVPKRPGRKPAKRKTSQTAPVVGSSKWPVGLPSDCYDSRWLASLNAKERKALKMKPAALQGVSALLD